MSELIDQIKLKEGSPRILTGWPSPQDYNEAVQNPHSCFSDGVLGEAQAELNFLGIPKTASGNFASVYHLIHSDLEWAVRCFLHPSADQEDRYKAISAKLAEVNACFLAEFSYLSKGINVANRWYPILKMEWLDGSTLLQYIESHLHDSAKLHDLASAFKQVILSMQTENIAHGDLQHGNIIVTGEGQIKLVDYDGVFVPELEGKMSSELGHSNYQHPARSYSDFNANMDNFSAWLIWISINALAEDPSLWQTLDSGNDCLLFKGQDLLQPECSMAFHVLESHSSEFIRVHARHLRSLLKQNPSEVPPLSNAVADPQFLPPLEPVIDPCKVNAKPNYLDDIEEANASLTGASSIARLSNYASGLNASQMASPTKKFPVQFLVCLSVLSIVVFYAHVASTKSNTASQTLQPMRVEKVAVQNVEKQAVEPAKQWQELMKDGTTAFTHGKYAEAESKYLIALNVSEQMVPQDFRQSQTLTSLAELYRLQGKYDNAEKLLKRALKISESTCGKSSNEMAQSLNNLARLYLTAGKYKEAEQLYSQAMGIAENAYSPQAAVLAYSYSGLAACFQNKGEYAKAEDLYKRGLETRENSAQVEDGEIAESYCNLATLYCSQGRYDEAEPLYKKAISLLENKFGAQHAYLANSLNSLASLYAAKGRYASATPLYKRALSISEDALGQQHPSVADSLNGLAALHCAMENYSAAEPLIIRAMRIRKTIVGTKHVFYADSLNKLAELYRKQQKLAKAEGLYHQALAIYKKVGNGDETGVAAVLNNIGLVHLSKGDCSRAEGLFQQARAINERKLGKDHPIVMTNLNNIASSLQAQGKYSDAEPLFKRALEIREKTLGPRHAAVAQSLRNLASLYLQQGKSAEAEELTKRAVAITGGASRYL